MPKLTINIDNEIDSLNKRYEELSILSINPQGPKAKDKNEQRVQILFNLKEIHQKIDILSLIKAHRSAAEIVVSRPTQEEIDSIQTALDRLDKVIANEQTFDETLKNVTALLEAADTVNTAAKSGKPK